MSERAVVVGLCACGGYGVVYDAEAQAELGKCHEPVGAGAVPPADWHLVERERNRVQIQRAGRDLLEQLAEVAADTLTTVDNWLGQASTKRAAADALWRLSRALRAIGVRISFSDLHWRGLLIANLERAGWRMGADGQIRRIIPGQPNCEGGRGITLAEFTEIHGSPTPAEDPYIDLERPHGV